MQKHISSQFDAELGVVSAEAMAMGSLVETQISDAIRALTEHNAGLAEKVIANEPRVNQYELEIDHDLSAVIARRQPAASDLRFLIAISKTTANLERAGDEANRIARVAKTLINQGIGRRMPVSELELAATLAINNMRRALDALARLDVDEALNILKDDEKIDIEFNGFVRKLVTFMMEDPRTISASLDLLFVAKALERVGDHAKNIAETVIYIAKGKDVRHQTTTDIEKTLQ